MTDDRVEEVAYVLGYVSECDELSEDGGSLWEAEVQLIGGYAAAATIYAGSEDAVRRMAEQAISAWNQRVDSSIESLQAEVEDLKHDLDRYMKIANIECNEAEDLRHILRAARPYISDRAGIGIIGAIDQALAAKEQMRDR